MEINKEIFKTLLDAENKAYGEAVETVAQYHEGYVHGIEDFLSALETNDTVDKIAKEKSEHDKRWDAILKSFEELWSCITDIKNM